MRYNVPYITVNVTVTEKSGTKNCKKWKAQLMRIDEKEGLWHMTDTVPADQTTGVVVFKPNVNLPEGNRLLIDLYLDEDHYGVFVRQDIGRPQKDVDIRFVLVPVGQEARTAAKRKPPRRQRKA